MFGAIPAWCANSPTVQARPSIRATSMLARLGSATSRAKAAKSGVLGAVNRSAVVTTPLNRAHMSAATDPSRTYGEVMTTTTTRAEAQYVHDEWDRRTRVHDIDGLLDLYTPDAVLESPLVPRIMDNTSGVLAGHEQLRQFFERGTRGRPNDAVRFCRTGEFLFQDGRL